MVVWFGKIVYRLQGTFYKKVLRIRRNAAKIFVVSELAS